MAAKKLPFAFITNAEFSPDLWAAISGLKSGVAPACTVISRLNQ
jgi:hypothetical protein